VLIPCLLGFWLVRRKELGPLAHLALATLVAGAAGNLIDRAIHGYVVDFIHLHHWPIFNVADICITLGAVGVFWLVLRPMQAAGRPTVGT